jgi:MGT family glycosyltransferase
MSLFDRLTQRLRRELSHTVDYERSVTKIALIAVPFHSHSAAVMRLGSVLASQGHELIVWAPERHRAEVDGWGARFELHEPTMPRTQGLGFAMELLETTESISPDLIDQLYGYGSEVVIHDGQAPWARVAGDYLGLSRLVAHPMFPIVAAFAKPSRSDPFLPAPPDHVAKERFQSSWASIARRWGVEIEDEYRTIHSGGRVMLAYTTQRVLGEHLLDSSWALMGPLMSPPPPTSRPERPLVYVCLGTAYNARAEPFRAVVDGLADEPVDVLVSTGNGRFVTEAALGPLPDNVTVQAYVDAREVLSRASLHITHGGCNSVHETLLAGVPMVFLPQAFDQFPLAQAIQRFGAGIVVEEQPFEVREAARLLLESDRAQASARDLSAHLLDYPGEAVLAEVIERVTAGDTTIAA